ncbi:MAG TPA: YafY family protein [Candidatus Didemnitutus sp.]|nr:YafY family protein [Candidatus Didemnitutus sp.]
MNRTDRLVAMVLHLQGRRVVRAEELAEHFEVNIRTVYRDIAALGEAGVPILGEAGVGYCLMKGYQLPPVMFSADEAASLFVGGELVKQFTDASLHAPMASALDKLRAVLPRERQDHVERLVSRTLVIRRPGPEYATASGQRWLLPVQQGVALRRVLQVTYCGRDQERETQRALEPLGVVFYGGTWYLVAWCRLRMDYRHFRVDRIRRLEITDTVFPARPDFSLTEHMKSQDRGQSIPARIWLARAVLPRAQRENPATLIAEKTRDGGTEYSLYTWSLPWLAHWLLSFGAEAEAVAPARLRTLVRTAAERVAARHAHRRQPA